MRKPSTALLLAVSLLAGCGGKGDKQQSLDLTFSQQSTVTPTTVVVGQDFQVGWNLFNADNLGGHVDNVAWTISRDGVPNAYSGTVPSIASRQVIAMSFVDHQPVGPHTYVITIDPANAVHELSENNNTRVVTVTVAPLVVQ